VLRELGTLPAGGKSVATAIEHRTDTIVGHSADPTPGVGTHGFVTTYQNNSFSLSDLNDLRSASQNWVVQDALDINSTGQILVSGITSGADQTQRLGLMRPKKGGTSFFEMTGSGDAVIDPQARDLSDQGQVAGSALDHDGNPHALLWTGTRAGMSVEDLGTLGGLQGRALGVNNYGYVVGDATTAKGRTHGFLYDPTTRTMLDLNSLIAGTGLTIDHAAAINNSNMIAAEGVDSEGRRHAILLSPKNPTPAPPTGIFYDGIGSVTINGTAGSDDILIGKDAGRDGKLLISLNGKGQKFLFAQIGAVSINGGSGDDHIEVRNDDASFRCIINGDAGDDRIMTNEYTSSSMIISGGEGNDLIRGPQTRTGSLSGDAGNDTIIGGDQLDIIAGGFGDDSIIGGGGANTLRGEAGNDTIIGGDGRESIDGGAGNDSIKAGGAVDYVNAGAGDDTVDAGTGDDTVFAGMGNDYVMAGEGNDFVYGDGGDDTIFGQAGNDTLGGDIGFGGDQANLPTPQPGNDSVDGGRGNDYLVGSRETLTFADDNGRDTFTGGAGGDVINARGTDVVTDAGADDIVPVAQKYGAGPFAVQQTATFQIIMPADETHLNPVQTTLGMGAGNFAGSTFYLDSAGTLHMQDTVDRKFYLGEFFRNWGVPINPQLHGGNFGRFFRAGITVRVNGVEVTSYDKVAIHNGDSIEVRVAV